MRVVLRCALCAERMPADPNCSLAAVLVCHWIERHRAEWLVLHPEATTVLE